MKDQIRKITERIKHFLQSRSLQFTLSISFTVAAVLGMSLVGVSLAMMYVNSTEDLTAKNNRRIVDQVNINLDSYLRSMMHVSDSIYYGVIKNADLKKNNISDQISLLYETNHDQIISVGVFTEKGNVIAAEPLNELKDTADVRTQDWFRSAETRIENLHFSTPHVENLFKDPDNKYHWVVSLSRYVEMTSAGTITHGVLLVDMNFSGIEQICSNVDLG